MVTLIDCVAVVSLKGVEVVDRRQHANVLSLFHKELDDTMSRLVRQLYMLNLFKDVNDEGVRAKIKAEREMLVLR